MPKHNFMISRAVDLVARKLAGMDPETIGRLTQVLSEEAQSISDELQHSGQNVDSDVLAARLDGLVTRMKYEFRNQVRSLLYRINIFLDAFSIRVPIRHLMNFLFSTFLIIQNHHIRIQSTISTINVTKKPTRRLSNRTNSHLQPLRRMSLQNLHHLQRPSHQSLQVLIALKVNTHNNQINRMAFDKHRMVRGNSPIPMPPCHVHRLPTISSKPEKSCLPFPNNKRWGAGKD